LTTPASWLMVCEKGGVTIKRILIISLISAAMFLGACAAPVTTPEYTLSVSVSPSGAGSVSPPGGKYESGLQVTLTATSTSGYTFDYWDGAASGSSHTVTITMDSNKSTTAHFKALTSASSPNPTPAPTPTSGYSRSNPVGVGIPLTITVSSVGSAGTEYNVRVTLLEVIRGTEAWQYIYAANMFNDPPKAGFEYILFAVRFDYLSGSTPDKTFDVSPVWFDVISGKGKEYEYVSVAGLDPDIRTSLYPAASHEGWIAFPIAQDDTSPLLTFGRAFDGTGGIWFKLY